MAIEARYLPGGPSNRLIKTVRRRLGSYGIRPIDRYWRLAWEWASAIRTSYSFPRWPMENEIAAQYMALLLAEMQRDYCLKLPYRASRMPAAVAAALPKSAPEILAITEERWLAAALADETPPPPLTITIEAAK